MKAWTAAAAGLNIHLSAGQIAQFETYLVLLLDWNKRLNLTAVREPDAIRQRHFLDSLTCVQAIGVPSGRFSLIDVGSGAGFPGIPLKIFYPQMQLTLVESVAKKARFLETVVAELELSGTAVLTERAEGLGQKESFREQFDWAAARAVAELRVLAEYLLPLCRIRGRMLAQKGPSAPQEVTVAESAIKALGGGIPNLIPVHLPDKSDAQFLVVVKKTAVTPNKYPRRPGMPGKRPL